MTLQTVFVNVYRFRVGKVTFFTFEQLGKNVRKNSLFYSNHIFLKCLIIPTCNVVEINNYIIMFITKTDRVKDTSN